MFHVALPQVISTAIALANAMNVTMSESKIRFIMDRVRDKFLILAAKVRFFNEKWKVKSEKFQFQWVIATISVLLGS